MFISTINQFRNSELATMARMTIGVNTTSTTRHLPHLIRGSSEALSRYFQVNDRASISFKPVQSGLPSAGFLSASATRRHDDVDVPSCRSQGSFPRDVRDVAFRAYPQIEYRAKARILGECPTHVDYIVERFAARHFRRKATAAAGYANERSIYTYDLATEVVRTND